jgi:hypothetical protein
MSGPSFYRNVVPLNRDRHRKLKLRTDGLMRFAARTHFVPIAAAEFFEAAREYPVVFAGSDDATPLAIVGLRDGENLYVDEAGRWAAGAYVPAYVRRYPFILARTGQGPSDYTVCLDEAYDGLSEADGTPLFDDEGKESELVSRIAGLLGDFLTETERTRRFVERLGTLELLTVQSMQVQDGAGRVYALRDFRMVDEQKLRALDDGTLGELHRSGYLGCIYAHLVSLGNVPRLAARLPAEPNGPAGGAEPAGDFQGRARG